MKKIVATAAALAFTVSLGACGEAGDKAAQETSEAVDATGNAMEAGAENAMQEAEEATDAAAAATEEAADATKDAAKDAAAASGAAVEEVGKEMQGKEEAK